MSFLISLVFFFLGGEESHFMVSAVESTALNIVGESSTNGLHPQPLCPERKDLLCDPASLVL